jgi:proteasome lid subunit RPN8/RPN11
MIVRIASAVAEAIMAHARADLPQEACGLLLGASGHIQQARPARNVADKPETRFEIDPALLLAAHRSARADGLSVIGHYHSHPNGHPEPSKRDAARAVQNGQIWLIATNAGLTAWSASTSGTLHGRFQPLALEHV